MEDSVKTRSIRRPRAAFTLVELLVVIGIIALLVAILLPALNKARRQANTVQCASNMKQIAAAMLNYINDNKGLLPPCTVSIQAHELTWVHGWFWATELVGQHYIYSPWATYTPANYNGALTTGVVTHSPAAGTVFQCPECVGDWDVLALSANISGSIKYPTDPFNFKYAKLWNDQNDSERNGNCDFNYGANTGIATNYMPFSTFINNGTPPANPSAAQVGVKDTDPPFLWFHPSDTTADAELASPAYRRTLTNVRRPSQLAMLLESNTSNTAYFTFTQNVSLSGTMRIAGRHGQGVVNRIAKAAGIWTATDAYTNIAFFDGHVALFPTQQFSENQQPQNVSVPQPNGWQENPGSDVIFYLSDQY